MSIVDNQITIHEYGLLIKGGSEKSLSASSIAEKDWEWLLQNEAVITGDAASLFRPTFKFGKHVLQVLNYVGVLTLPSGAQIEILPKVTEAGAVDESRTQLFKMLTKVYDLPSIQFNDANLKTEKNQLLEVLIGRFLRDAQHLLNRGLRSQYTTVEKRQAFLKGRLHASNYLQQPPAKRMLFPISYDEYLLDRPENRLLHWAIDRVYHWSRDEIHRAHARKLLMLLGTIPKSANPLEDLKLWHESRLMQHYNHVKPWIELIANNLSPWSQAGNSRGISLLFPMEQLFEKYVFKILKERIEKGHSLHAQVHAGYLTQHKGKSWCLMKPDIMIQAERLHIGIIDTKWKKLDENETDKKYLIKEADLYQLFAYGKKCLPEGGTLFLVYPKSNKFQKPLPVFTFGDMHRLWVVPFCLGDDVLIHGEWTMDAPYLDDCTSSPIN